MANMSLGRSRPRSIALAVSLGLNVAVAGWGTAQVLAPARYTRSDTAPEVVSKAMAAALPPADGDLLLRAIDGKRPLLQDARRRYLAALEHARQLISAEPLDVAALHDAVAEVRATRQAEHNLFGDTVVDTLPRLSPQGRQAFVTRIMGGGS